MNSPEKPRLGSDIIPRVVITRSVYIILTIAVFLYMAGHNAPGGGFIAGLLTAGGLALLYILKGSWFAKEFLRFDMKLLIAIGLICAAGCGLGACFFGYPFLTHNFGHFDLFILGEMELATAMIFDLGVYLVVVGGMMTIVTAVGEDR